MGLPEWAGFACFPAVLALWAGGLSSRAILLEFETATRHVDSPSKEPPPLCRDPVDPARTDMIGESRDRLPQNIGVGMVSASPISGPRAAQHEELRNDDRWREPVRFNAPERLCGDDAPRRPLGPTAITLTSAPR
jgi:hypothetical protein